MLLRSAMQRMWDELDESIEGIDQEQQRQSESDGSEDKIGRLGCKRVRPGSLVASW